MDDKQLNEKYKAVVHDLAKFVGDNEGEAVDLCMLVQGIVCGTILVLEASPDEFLPTLTSAVRKQYDRTIALRKGKAN